MTLNIGIVGGGIGGFCTAIALRQMGHSVELFEQAQQLNRVGADVNLTPNAVFALDKLGCADALRSISARPTFRISRDGITGEETSRLPMSDAAEQKYGAPQLAIHRGDLLKTLSAQLPHKQVHLGQPIGNVTVQAGSATLSVDGGSDRNFDLIVGADGVHSVVRHALFGKDDPTFTGLVSYRSVFPRSKTKDILDPDAFTKWWGKTSDKQIVTFPLTGGKEIFVFATTPENKWTEEGWTIPGDVEKLRAAYADFHPAAKALLAACEDVTCSALHVREPMNAWSKGCVTVLGDAAHPMVPFMAQGACMAIEDAIVLVRCLEGVSVNGVESALMRYEQARMDRTATVQRMSLENEWMKKPGNADWLYGYDAWNVEIANGTS